MRRPTVVWLSIGAGLVALDLYCDRNPVPGDTISEVARVLYRTHTPLGRAVFTASWCALSAWLVPHICRVTTQEA